jgi:lysophospholipase L1-like esterase
MMPVMDGYALCRALKSDPIHPNARGYKLIAERLAASLKASGAI